MARRTVSTGPLPAAWAPRTCAVFTQRSSSKDSARSCSTTSASSLVRSRSISASRAARAALPGDDGSTPTLCRRSSSSASGPPPAAPSVCSQPSSARSHAAGAAVALPLLAVGGAVDDGAQRLGHRRAAVLQGRRTSSRPRGGRRATSSPMSGSSSAGCPASASAAAGRAPARRAAPPRAAHAAARLDAGALRDRPAPARPTPQAAPPAPPRSPSGARRLFAEQHHVGLQVVVRHAAVVGERQAAQGIDATARRPPGPRRSWRCRRSASVSAPSAS